MPASTDRIRRSMHVAPTAKDKGLELTLRVTAYDNGRSKWTAFQSTTLAMTAIRPRTAGSVPPKWPC